MKGYLIELRKKSKPNMVVSSGSVFAGATAERRAQMASRLYGRSPKGLYIVIEYDTDWTDCVSPSKTEINRYEIGEEVELADGKPIEVPPQDYQPKPLSLVGEKLTYTPGKPVDPKPKR